MKAKPMRDVFFTEPDASRLDEERHKARETKGRLTYDCFSAKVKGDRVHCDKGHPLFGKRAVDMSLLSVLRGRTSICCKGCPDFDGEPLEVI